MRLEAMPTSHKVATAWLIRRVIEDFVEREPAGQSVVVAAPPVTGSQLRRL